MVQLLLLLTFLLPVGLVRGQDLTAGEIKARFEAVRSGVDDTDNPLSPDRRLAILAATVAADRRASAEEAVYVLGTNQAEASVPALPGAGGVVTYQKAITATKSEGPGLQVAWSLRGQALPRSSPPSVDEALLELAGTYVTRSSLFLQYRVLLQAENPEAYRILAADNIIRMAAFTRGKATEQFADGLADMYYETTPANNFEMLATDMDHVLGKLREAMDAVAPDSILAGKMMSVESLAAELSFPRHVVVKKPEALTDEADAPTKTPKGK